MSSASGEDSVDADNESPPSSPSIEFAEGERVRILHGKYAGEEGQVSGGGTPKMIYVTIDGENHRLHRKSVQKSCISNDKGSPVQDKQSPVQEKRSPVQGKRSPVRECNLTDSVSPMKVKGTNPEPGDGQENYTQDHSIKWLQSILDASNRSEVDEIVKTILTETPCVRDEGSKRSLTKKRILAGRSEINAFNLSQYLLLLLDWEEASYYGPGERKTLLKDNFGVHVRVEIPFSLRYLIYFYLEHTTPSIRSRVLQEIVTEVVAYRIADLRDRGALSMTYLQHLVEGLAEGQEIHVPSGWKSHCVAVCVHRVKDMLVTRVDNTGQGSDVLHPCTTHLKDVAPLLLHQHDRVTGISKLMEYLARVTELGSDDTQAKNFKTIYKCPLNPTDDEMCRVQEESDRLLELVREQGVKGIEHYRRLMHKIPSQAVGNCVLATHHQGMHVRMGRWCQKFLEYQRAECVSEVMRLNRSEFLAYSSDDDLPLPELVADASL